MWVLHSRLVESEQAKHAMWREDACTFWCNEEQWEWVGVYSVVFRALWATFPASFLATTSQKRHALRSLVVVRVEDSHLRSGST